MRHFIFGILIISATAQADLSGQWLGQGKAQDFRGWSAVCDPMEFRLEQSTTEFAVQFGHYECGSLSVTWRPFAMKVKGNELWYNGQHIGTIESDHLHAVVEGAHDTKIYDITRSGDQILYREEWQDSHHTTEMLFEGALQLKP